VRSDWGRLFFTFPTRALTGQQGHFLGRKRREQGLTGRRLSDRKGPRVRSRFAPAVSRANRRFLVIVTVASAGVANAVHHRHIIGRRSRSR
jgi:hypothetical protein